MGVSLQRGLTFEALTACLIVEVFFATIVRYVSTILLDLSPWINLVPSDLSEAMLVKALEGREVDGALGLGLDEAPSIFDHLGVFSGQDVSVEEQVVTFGSKRRSWRRQGGTWLISSSGRQRPRRRRVKKGSQ